MRLCSRPRCGKPVNARGFCSMHYKRFRLYGDPEALPRFTRDPAVRFWAKVDRRPGAGCWQWRGKINNNGYGTMQVGRRSLGQAHTVIAHRFAYEDFIGPIPPGLQLDHLCRNRLCVNPAHLEPVTPAENTRRAAAFVTACKYGHAYTPQNIYRQPSTGRRSCVTCRNMRSRGLDPADLPILKEAS